jgi:hypothetical protein
MVVCGMVRFACSMRVEWWYLLAIIRNTSRIMTESVNRGPEMVDIVVTGKAVMEQGMQKCLVGMAFLNSAPLTYLYRSAMRQLQVCFEVKLKTG